MIIQEELNATLDEPKNCLSMHRAEPSRLQLLVLSLTDKLNQLAEYNEPCGRNHAGTGNWAQHPARAATTECVVRTIR